MVMIYMEFVILSLLAMWEVGTPTVYIFISCISMPQNCIRSGKSCHMYAIFTMFSSSKIPFLHFIMALFMLGVPSLHHKHHVVLIIFTIFYLKQKIWILWKWCCIMKKWKLYNPLLVEYDVYVRKASYINVK